MYSSDSDNALKIFKIQDKKRKTNKTYKIIVIDQKCT